MKNTKIFSLVAIVLLSLLWGCTEKITTTNLTVDMNTKGTVVIKFYAELDMQATGPEKVPQGTVITITAPLNQLNPAAPNGINWDTTATVGADGTITIDLPTRANGVTFTFHPSEFTYNVKAEYVYPGQTKEMKFTLNSFQITLYPKQKKIEEYFYSGTTTSNNFITVNRKYKGEYYTDFSVWPYTQSVIPAGTTIYAYNNGWMATTTVGINGEFTIDQPYSQNIYFRFNISIKDNDNNTKLFRLTSVTTYSATESSPAAVNISPNQWTYQLWQ